MSWPSGGLEERAFQALKEARVQDGAVERTRCVHSRSVLVGSGPEAGCGKEW